MTAPAAQLWPVSPVTPERNNIPKKRPRADVVDVVPIVLAAADGDHGSAKQRCQTKERARQVTSRIDGSGLVLVSASVIEIVVAVVIVPGTVYGAAARRPAGDPAAHDKQPHLSRQEQTQVPQSREAETRMSARKTAPAVVEHVAARLGAHLDPDERILGRARRGFASRDEIRAGSADGVLDGVGYEGGQHQGDEEAQDRHMVFVLGCAREEVDCDDNEQRDGAGVDDVPGDGDALDFGVGEGDG